MTAPTMPRTGAGRLGTPDTRRPMREADVALRLRSGAQHLHDLGARATAELFTELVLAHGHGFGEELVIRLERYRRLTPAMVARTGAHRFPPLLREVTQ